MRARENLVYICDWLPPDFGAVGQYALIRCREEAARGRSVVLVGLSADSHAPVVEKVGRGQLRVIRLRSRPTPRESWTGRLVWAIGTNLRLLRAAAPHAKRARSIIFTGSPPFMLPFVLFANLFWRRRIVYRMTDFWPECAIAALGREPPGWRFVQRAFAIMRRRVDEIEVLGEDQRERLLEQGIPPEKIRLRRDPSPVSIPPGTPPLTRPEKLSGYRILLYSGNWGVAHEVDTFVEGYTRHHRDGLGAFALWLNATGAGADEVERRLLKARVPFLRTRPVPLGLLPRLLVTADAHLITLKDAFVGYVLPSKVYACIESGRPILFVGSDRSDVHRLCSDHCGDGRYARVAVGDPAGVAAALDDLVALCRPVEAAS